MARSDGPFEYFDEVYPGNGRISGSTMRSGVSAPGQDSLSILTLADDLADDKRAVDRNAEGDIQRPLHDRHGKVEKAARGLSANGLYFVGVVTDFSHDVDTFDTSVSGLNTKWADEVRRRVNTMMHEPDVRAGDVTVDRGAIGQDVKAQFQGEYTQARTTLRGRIGLTKTRFEQGPTDDNVRALITGGYLPLEAASAFPTLALSASDRAAAIGKSFWTEWVGFKPPIGKGPMDWFGWGFGTLGFGFGAGIDWARRTRIGNFKPIGANGRYVSFNSLNAWGRFKAGFGRFPTAKGLSPLDKLRGFNPEGHWGPKRGQATTYAKWGKVSTIATRTGGAVTAVTSGWNEWNESAEYPADERIGRSVTKGTATAAGAMVGAKGGAMLGAAIGTAIFPGAGTVVGGAVGGLIGGFAGAKVGEEIGDAVKDYGGKAAEAVSDGAKKVADKLSFWD